MKTICVAAFAITCGLLGTIHSTSAVAAGGGVLPGQYRVTTAITGQAKPSIRYECYTAADIAGMIELPPAEGECTASRSTVAGGRIDIARSCTGPRGVVAGSITGTYSPIGFAFRMLSRGGALLVPLDIRTVGQRTAATCAAD